jgi:hypothetical protein
MQGMKWWRGPSLSAGKDIADLAEEKDELKVSKKKNTFQRSFL